MNPELLKQVRRTASQTTLRAQRIVEELKSISSTPPPKKDGGGPDGNAE